MDIYGQTDSVGPTVWRMIYLLIALVVAILFFMIYRRLRGKMGGSDQVSSAGLDLITLKKKGLLTPEELERVGQSMIRQMKEKEEAERRKRGLKSADALLLDPEVRRLEVLAAAKAKAEESAPKPQHAQPSIPESSPISTAENHGPPHRASVVEQEEDLSSVELPLDVQQLVDSGLLSDEEVRNVKRRLLERRRLSGQ